MFQDENLCFRRDIFNLDHKSWNNFGSGNTIELKGNLLKFTVNNNIKNIKKNKSQYDLTNIEPFKTIYSNTNNSTVHSFISKDIINKETDNKENKNDVGKLNKTKEDNNSETKFNKERNKYKSKSLTNKFNREDRYDNVFYKKELLEKYYPDPGDYEIEEYDINNQKNPLRYESLFKSKSSFPLIELKKTMYKIGPGSYNYLKEQQINGGTFSKLENKNIISKSEEENRNLGPGSIDLPGGINVRDKNIMSHFFLLAPNKEENLEKKYNIERSEIKQRNRDFNQFGEFNAIPRWSNREKTKDFNNDWINQNLEKKINEEKKKGNIINVYDNLNGYENEKTIKQDVFYWAKMANDQIKQGAEKAKKKKGAYSFSKIPKLIEENKHVPGPAFYSPDKILNAIKKKKEFNCNVDSNWI